MTNLNPDDSKLGLLQLGNNFLGTMGYLATQNPAVFTDYANNKTSILVQDQLPEFIKSNYPTFIAFIEAYYEFLEQDTQLNTISKNLPNLLDVDYVNEKNLTDFIELFRRQYLNRIPATVLANKALLTKHIKDFYTSRGTQKSFKLLFRILFNEDVDIFNTGNQVLIASGGKWLQPNVLRIRTTNNLVDFVNTQISGSNSFASAIIDTATVNFSNGVSYDELTLNSIIGSFLPNETITAKTLKGNTLIGVVSGSISDITVMNGGHSYNVGDPVLISGNGGANAFVSQVSIGGLETINIITGGAGFAVFPTFSTTLIGDALQQPIIEIASIDTSGNLSPNSFIINSSTISLLAVPPLNSIINTTLNYITYANCGPIQIVQVLSPGIGIKPTDQLNIQQVTQFVPGGGHGGSLPAGAYIQDYGSIGLYKVINGGINYQVGDDVKFTNITARGIGAGARVKSISGNGSILSVVSNLPTITGRVSTSNTSNIITGFGTLFTTELLANNDITYPGSGSIITVNNQIFQVTTISNDTTLTVNTTPLYITTNKVVGINGLMVGGVGYQNSDFPNGVTLNVSSPTGTGATIIPVCILGTGANLQPVINSSYGTIEQIKLTSFGQHYTSQPIIDLTKSGDGTATANATFINGIFQYPGYYSNEDGMLSARRYLQDPNIYNSYSYMLRSPLALSSYQKVVNDLLSPTGTNLVAEVISEKNNVVTITTSKTITLQYTHILGAFVLGTDTLGLG